MKRLTPRSLQTVIIVLIAVGLVLMALGGYFNVATRQAGRAAVSAQAWLSQRYLALVDFLTVPRDLISLRRENAQLRAEVARLQGQIVQLQQQVTETEILAALVNFARTNPESDYRMANVIGRDPSPFLHYVIIDVGSSQGIRPGMPVVTEQGLVGRVEAVAAEAARVRLITDPASQVNVRLQGSETEALLIGSITGELSLEMIPQDVTVQAGDVVLTSGLGGGYPPNLLVGQVVTVRKFDYELFQQAVIQPTVDFSRLYYVLVITNFRPVDISPLVPSP
ncbi:MAG: rod shape-determining protein MreC [Anaerolineales bacterium]